MTREGDTFLMDQLVQAIELNRHPAKEANKVCPSHEGIRAGVHVLLLCRKADLERSQEGRHAASHDEDDGPKTREVNILRGLISFKNMSMKSVGSVLWKVIVFLFFTTILLNQLGFKVELKQLLLGGSPTASVLPVPVDGKP